MADARPRLTGDRLPTLTEVVFEGRPVPAGLAADDEARIVEAVLAGLQQRMDLMFEYRLREAISPVLERIAGQLVAEAREELARTLRDVVSRAVSQELLRRRPR